MQPLQSSASVELWGRVKRAGEDLAAGSQESESQRHILELEDICLSLRQELQEKNRRVDSLEEEVKFQRTLASNFQVENEQLLSEVRRLQSAEHRQCRGCAELQLRIDRLSGELAEQTAKLSTLANETIVSASLAQELATERISACELRMEISDLKKQPQRSAKIFKTLQSLETLVKNSKNSDETLASLFSVVRKLSENPGDSQISEDALWRAKLTHVEQLWTAKLKLLRAEHERLCLEYQAALRDQQFRNRIQSNSDSLSESRSGPSDRLAQLRIAELERELQVTNQLFAKKLAGASDAGGTTKHQMQQLQQGFYVGNAEDLRLFLALPLGRALGELLGAPEADADRVAVRKLVERTLQTTTVREELLEEALREACEENELLRVVAADMEMNGVRKWRDMPAVLTRCGVDSRTLDRKISEFPETRIDTKRLLCGRTRDVRDQIVGG